MKDSSVIYCYKDKGENYKKLGDFCTKTDMYFFECESIDQLMYILEGARSCFIVIDKDADINNEQLEEISRVKKVYYMNEDYKALSKNIIVTGNVDKTIEKIKKDNIETQKEIEQDKMLCYEVINYELDKLSFRAKLIGAKYLADLVYEQFRSRIRTSKCVAIFPLLAQKYDTNTSSVERAIRFSILRAFENCEDKQLFYDISKTKKPPTVKEMATYLLNRVNYEKLKANA